MTIGGEPIVPLTKKTIVTLLAKFSHVEEKMYEATHRMAKAEYDSLVSSTSKLSAGEFVYIIEKFLRLRQACCDPGLLLDASKAKVEKQTVKKEKEDDENPDEKWTDTGSKIGVGDLISGVMFHVLPQTCIIVFDKGNADPFMFN